MHILILGVKFLFSRVEFFSLIFNLLGFFPFNMSRKEMFKFCCYYYQNKMSSIFVCIILFLEWNSYFGVKFLFFRVQFFHFWSGILIFWSGDSYFWS